MRTAAHIAAEHLHFAAWIFRAPAMSASRLDLPTPSGPIKPTYASGGNVQVDVAQGQRVAIAQPDLRQLGDRSATCVARNGSLRQPGLQSRRPVGVRIEAHVGDAWQPGLHLRPVFPERVPDRSAP